MVEDFDLSSRFQDFHHKLDLGNVEDKANQECEDDGNVGGDGGCNHWTLK